MKTIKTILDNGVRVVASPSADTKSVSAIIAVKTGSRNEPEKINGISHFLEHMVFKGTKKRPTTLDISRELENLGAQENASTEKEKTSFYTRVSSEYFKESLDVLQDLVANPLLKEKDIEMEKGVILEEKKMYEENPIMYIEDLFSEAFFSDKRMSREIIGEIKSIKDIKRKDFLAYKSEYYKTGNIIVSVTGDLPKNYLKIIKEMTQGFKKGEETDWGIEPSIQKGQIIRPLDAKQTNMILGYPGLSYGDKRIAAFKLLSVILGSGMSSRLFQEIREKRGLAYAIYSDIIVYSDSGYLEINSAVDSKNVEKSLGLTIKEVQKFKNTVSEQELRLAKNRLKGSLILGMENTLNRADLLAKREIYHLEVKSVEEIVAEFEKVNLDEIKALAEEIFSSRPSLAVIGPFKKGQNLLESY